MSNGKPAILQSARAIHKGITYLLFVKLLSNNTVNDNTSANFFQD